MTAPNISSIPTEIQDIPRWVLWKWEQRADRTTGELKWTKPPYQPNGQHAESDNPATWATFKQAVAAYETGSFSGIGFVVTEEDEFAGVDLDHVHDSETGVIEPWAMKIVQALNSYTEISPSGTGLRIFLRAKLPPKDRKIGSFECYESGRYLTVTGNHVEGTPTTVEHRQAEMDAVHAEMFAERNRARSNGHVGATTVLPDLDDQEVLKKAFNAKNGPLVQRLYYGDMSGYVSHSEADLALCGLLAFWTGPDVEKIDRLYRSSDLCSHKWDDSRGESTWGLNTSYKALEGRTEFYGGSRNGHGGYSSGESAEKSTAADVDWPEMEELPTVAVAPALSADMLPESIRPWLLDIARQGSFPLAMVAAPAVIAISSIIGRKLAIRPWLFSDFTIIVNLWGDVIVDPSTMKSYAISEGTKPLKRLAATAHDRFQVEEATNEADRLAIEAELKAITSEMEAAAKGKPLVKGQPIKDMGFLKEQYTKKKQELQGAQPVEHRYWVADVTPEKLGMLLIDNPNGLLVSYDELTGWLGEMEKPGREGSRSFYLTAWEGDGEYYTDRVVRGTNYIPAVCLSVIGGIQTDRLQPYLDEALGGGHGGDGMIQRFQVSVKIDDLGEWVAPTSWPDTTAKNRAFEVFKWLDETDLAAFGQRDSPEAKEPPYVRFSPEAQELADQWHDELEIRLRGPEFQGMPAFKAHIGKYRSLMPSLALIFQLLDQAGTDGTPISKDFPPEKFSVSGEAVTLAEDWCDFLELHARAIYQAEITPGVEAAGRLAKKIEEGRIHHRDVVRDIYRHHWSGLATSTLVSSGLEVLESVGWVRLVALETVTTPTTVLYLHPTLREVKNG
jgi:hypothetical protein